MNPTIMEYVPELWKLDRKLRILHNPSKHVHLMSHKCIPVRGKELSGTVTSQVWTDLISRKVQACILGLLGEFLPDNHLHIVLQKQDLNVNNI